jgi:hypothetical protein
MAEIGDAVNPGADPAPAPAPALAPAPAPAAAAPAPAPAWRLILNALVNVALMYLMYTYVFGGGRSSSGDGSPMLNASNVNGSSNGGGGGGLTSSPAWPTGVRFHAKLYLSDKHHLSYDEAAALTPAWTGTDLEFSWDAPTPWRAEIDVAVPLSVQNNGSYYAHLFAVRDGFPLDPAAADYSPAGVLYGSHALVRFLPRPRVGTERSLLDDAPTAEEAAAAAAAARVVPEVIAFWQPNVTINLLLEDKPFVPATLPGHTSALLKQYNGMYLPIVFFNDFWVFREHLVPVNETTPRLPLGFELGYLSLFRLSLYCELEKSLEMQVSMGISSNSDPDEFKRLISDTNPYLLGLTMAVSILHTVFDFLAFKNDISFWREQKDMSGLSVRSIFINIIFQLVIFLYLFENETSWLVLISILIGLVIECWKVTRATDVSVDRTFPYVHIADKSSYTSTTREYDQQAMRVLSYAAIPLLVGCSVYSLMYQTHRGWYSWALSSLVGAIYTFGFITMTPQLFINYKLRSVAHLPWRAFVYKALNTFVDDLFAFIIKMPTLHRLACLRDDLIFLIFLYQRWIYPVDMSRTNEFGQVFVDPASAASPDPAAVPADGPGHEKAD